LSFFNEQIFSKKNKKKSAQKVKEFPYSPMTVEDELIIKKPSKNQDVF
jgi:hypothetical protein